jgi:predicted porin
MSTVYKSYGAMLDPAYRTVAQQRDVGLQSLLHSGRGSDGQGRATNTVRYDTPTWNGLSAAGSTTVRPDSDTPSHNNPYSAGVKYENGGILVFADYVTNNSGGDDSAYSLGGKWTIDKFALFGQYEFDKGLITDVNTGTLGQNNNGDGADIWMVGATYTMGNNTLYAGYGSQTDSAETRDLGGDKVTATKYKSWELVGIHTFSKRTLAYAGYVGVDPDSDYDTVAHYTLGMKHTF